MLLLNASLKTRKFQRGGALLYIDGVIQEFLMGTYRVGELEEGVKMVTTRLRRSHYT